MQKSSSYILFSLIALILGAGGYFLSLPASQTTVNLGPSFEETAESEDSRYSGTMGTESAPAPDDLIAGAADRTSVNVADLGASASEQSKVGMISGRVVDAGGAPLAGARVIIGGGDPLPLMVEMDSNRGFGRRWSTVSSADGTFELKGPEPGELRVGASLAGFVPTERESLALPTDGMLDVGDIPLEISVVLEGRVIVEGGGGVAGAELFARDPGGNSWFGSTGTPAVAISNEAGFFRVDSLSAGPWEIEVKSAEQPNRIFKGRSEQPGEIQSGLQFSLEPGMRISGYVSGALAAELDGLEISAQSSSNRSSNRSSMRRMGQSDARTATIQPNGSFVIGGCKPEQKYTISASRSNSIGNPWGRGGQAVTERIDAIAGATGVEVPWIGSTGLAFQVVDAVTGLPIENFYVNYGSRWMQPFEIDGEPVIFHKDGRVQLSELDANPGRGGDFKVAIEAAGYGSLEKEFELSEGELLAGNVLSLERVALLSVIVLDDATGAPIEGASVSISVGGDGNPTGMVFGRMGNRGGGAAGERRVAKSEADGVASLSSFEGQVGKLVVEHEMYTTWTVEALTMPAGAPLGIEARLGVGGKVMVTALDATGSPIAGARVETRQPDPEAAENNGPGGGRAMRMFMGGDGGAAVANADGVATFRNLEPGWHEFHLAESGGGAFGMVFSEGGGADPWDGVDVIERGEHELVLRQEPVATLGGRVTENGSNLAGAELALIDGSNPMSGFRFGGSASGPGTGKTDGRGNFSLSEIAPGSYTLEISHPGRAMKSMIDIDLAAGENSFDVNLSLAIVEGRVRDSEGTPVSGVKVLIRRAEGGSNPRVRGFMMTSNGESFAVDTDGADPSVTDADGRYSLRGVETGVKVVVSASVQGMSPAQSDIFKVSEGETKSGTDLVVEPAGTVSFAIEGLPENTPALVNAVFVDDESVEAKTSFSRTGEGTLQGLKPGLWRLSARAMSQGGPAEDVDKTVDVLVHPGQESEVVLEI